MGFTNAKKPGKVEWLKSSSYQINMFLFLICTQGWESKTLSSFSFQIGNHKQLTFTQIDTAITI